MVHAVLWSVQILLAVFFLAAGAPKLLGRGLGRWTGFSDLPRGLVLFIGITEASAAAGLVLPMATGVLPWLTPLAALGLVGTVLMAAGFHVRAGEWLPATETGLWASIALVVAIGRWELIASPADVPATVLMTSLALLVPAVLMNLVVLWRRTAHTAATAGRAARWPAHEVRPSRSCR